MFEIGTRVVVKVNTNRRRPLKEGNGEVIENDGEKIKVRMDATIGRQSYNLIFNKKGKGKQGRFIG